MLDHLSPGEHLCHFFETDEDRRIVALEFIKQGLIQGERIIVLSCEHKLSLYLPTNLTNDSNLQDLFAKGDFVVFSKKFADETSEDNPEEFDVDQFTDWLTAASEVTSHFDPDHSNTCVRVLADMSCILHSSNDVGQLETYEELVNQYFTANHCIVLCQYDRLRYSPHQLNEALISHPSLVINQEVVKNFYYTPPTFASDDDLAQARFDQWIKNLMIARENEKELNLTHAWIEIASDMAFWFDESGRIVYANSTACERLGYTRSELLRLNISHIVPSYSNEKYWLFIRQSGSSQNETQIFTQSREMIPIEFKCNLMNFSGVEYVCAIAHDITEHKNREKLQQAIYQISEAAISAHNEQELFENVHEIVASLIPARNLFIAIYDKPTDTLSFPYFVDEYDVKPASRKGGKGLTEYLIRTGKPVCFSPDSDFNMREHGILYTGTYAPGWMGVPLKTTDNRIIGALVVQSYDYQIRYTNEDLEILSFVSTQVAMSIERQRAKAELHKSEENFRMLVEGIKDYAAYMLDVDGNIISWNSGAERMNGYQASEIIGKHISIFYTETDQNHNLPKFELSLAAHKENYEHEGWRVRKDGSLYYANVVVTALYDPDGKVYGYIKLVRDITSTRKPNEGFVRERRPSALDDF